MKTLLFILCICLSLLGCSNQEPSQEEDVRDSVHMPPLSWEAQYVVHISHQEYEQAAEVARRFTQPEIGLAKIRDAFDHAMKERWYGIAMRIVEFMPDEDKRGVLLEVYRVTMTVGFYPDATNAAQALGNLAVGADRDEANRLLMSVYEEAIAKHAWWQAGQIDRRFQLVEMSKPYRRRTYDATGKLKLEEELTAPYADCCPHSYEMDCATSDENPIRVCTFGTRVPSSAERKLEQRFVAEAVRQINILNRTSGSQYCAHEPVHLGYCDAGPEGCGLQELTYELEGLHLKEKIPMEEPTLWRAWLKGVIDCGYAPKIFVNEKGPLPQDVMDDVETLRGQFLDECKRQSVAYIEAVNPGSAILLQIMLRARHRAWLAIPLPDRKAAFARWQERCMQQPENPAYATVRFLLSEESNEKSFRDTWICKGLNDGLEINVCGEMIDVTNDDDYNGKPFPVKTGILVGIVETLQEALPVP